MYKPYLKQRKAIRFRHFRRKGYALFACLGRMVTIGVLSVSTLKSATAAQPVSFADVVTADTIGLAEKEATLDDVEIIGSRAPLALGQAARMVTVLTRDDIQAAPALSINDLLKMAVGVDVRQRGPLGAQTDVGIRGGSQEQITILLNGVNICDPQTGHNAFDLPVDISQVERIEVLEGPAGRIYGTSSLAGAVNIVTIADAGHGDQTQVKAHAEGGSFGFFSAGGRFAYADGPLAQSLSAGYMRSDGYSRAKSGDLNSDYKGGKAFYQGQYAANDLKLQWHAGLSIRGFGSNTFYSAHFDEQFERTAKIFTAVQGEAKAGGLHLRPSVYWDRAYDRFELIRGSQDLVPFNHHRTDVFGVNVNSWFDSPVGRTAVGAEFRNEDIVSGNLGEPLNKPHGDYLYGLNRSNLSLHLLHSVALSKFTLSGGFIAVKNTWNEMPFTLYPGADASLRLGDHLKVYASYNTSLRMPSFTELYYSVGGRRADKYLRPEELKALEGGVKLATNCVQAQAAVFHHHCRDMIDWVMDTRDVEPVWQSVNHTKVNTLGLEAQASIALADLIGVGQDALLAPKSLRLAYCYMDQQKDEEQYLQSQATLEYLRHKMTASLQMHVASALSLTVDYRYQCRTGTYTNVDGIVRDYRPYSILDARLAWDKPGYCLYVEANNLLDHVYVDFGNVPQPGFWITAGARITLDL